VPSIRAATLVAKGLRKAGIGRFSRCLAKAASSNVLKSLGESISSIGSQSYRIKKPQSKFIFFIKIPPFSQDFFQFFRFFQACVGVSGRPLRCSRRRTESFFPYDTIISQSFSFVVNRKGRIF
jgi:hypothetical protein